MKQIDNPDQRTRIKILFPASISEIPVESVKKKTAIQLGFLWGIFVVLFSLYREFFHPAARDDLRSKEEPVEAT